MSEVEIVLALLVAFTVLATLAVRLRVPYPILLVIGGAALGFVPELPRIQIDPEAVFLIFVPPLVFAAAFYTSWRDFAANARPIFSLAVGLVLASALIIAATTHALLGIAWAPALVFGAVVSNTDTSAIVSIAQQVGLPRRVMTILEGESLVNDAMSLTAFRIAVLATVTGVFSLREAAGEFLLAVFGAVVVGVGVGWLTAEARSRVLDPRIAIVVSVLMPYAAYLPADQLGASGILAVVIAGLYVGRQESRIEDAVTRLEARAVWDVFVFGLNGLLFILVGVQLRPIWEALQGYDVRDVVVAAALVNLVVIATRIVWVFIAAAVPRWFGLHRRSLLDALGWREVAIVAWAGLRGADTLAAALSVPLVTAADSPFPARAEILFLAFTVILVTLVGQGLTLPPLIRWLGIAEDEVELREERPARRVATEAALSRLDQLSREEDVPAGLIESLRGQYAHRAGVLSNTSDDQSAREHAVRHARLRREVLAAQRNAVVRLRDSGQINDKVLRQVQRDLGLEDVRLEM